LLKFILVIPPEGLIGTSSPDAGFRHQAKARSPGDPVRDRTPNTTSGLRDPAGTIVPNVIEAQSVPKIQRHPEPPEYRTMCERSESAIRFLARILEPRR
jgi:hypothetical protein